MAPRKRAASKINGDADTKASIQPDDNVKRTRIKREKKSLQEQIEEPDSTVALSQQTCDTPDKSTKDLKRKGRPKNTKTTIKRFKNETGDEESEKDSDEHNIPSQSDAIDTKVKPKGRRTKNKMDEISKDEDLVKEQDLENENGNDNTTQKDSGTTTEKKSRKGSGVKRGKKGNQDVIKGDSGANNSKTVLINGKAPVDSYCIQKLGKAHVYCEGDDVWDCMLNQTNLQFNNNKYYVIQLLEDDNKKTYSVWFRWGRVGNKGQNNLVDCGTNLERAKMSFMKKFEDKTKNSWNDRASFEKVPGKYDLLKMDYSAKTNDDKHEVDSKIKKEPIKIPDSKLDKQIQDLIELICNVKAMEDTVIEMKYDSTKAPLGRLTTEQIKAGYKALQEIEELLNKNVKGKGLLEACNRFYTRIPHNFGMRTPPLITTRAEIIEKMQLLEILGDIEVAMTLIKEATAMLENPIDNNYKCLQCALNPIPRESKMFKIIDNYLQNTHEKSHNLYKMELMEVFECCKEGEEENFTNVGNRVLLWHGSRLTNWAGILKRGLQIAPSEAPVTGYMFGKGVYFADRSSKSANYCYSTKTKNIGLLLLCEVALGKCHELLQANYNADKLPKGKHSVKGIGMLTPNSTDDIQLDDGTIIPLGKSCNAKDDKNFALNYNEYVIYNTNQIKMRYLVKVKFHFK